MSGAARLIVVLRQVRKGRGKWAPAFTLAEVLVALTLTIVAVLAVINVFPTSLASVQASGDTLQAQAIAQRCLDQIREYYQTGGAAPLSLQPGTNYVFTAQSGTIPNSSNSFQQFRGVAQTAQSYEVSYTSTDLSTAQAPTPEHDVVLTVTWTAGNGSHTWTFEEYVQN